MAGWNDANFNAVDWTSRTFLGMFCDAAAERWNAGIAGSPPTLPAIGDDVQDHAIIAKFQLIFDMGNNPNWVNPTIVGTVLPTLGDGSISDLKYQRWSELFTAAGLDPGHGYERRRPREIDSTTATADTQGNAAGSGQVARLTVSPAGLYSYNGTTWVAYTGTASADVLSNYSDAPNTVADISVDVVVDETIEAAIIGDIQVGDYIGPWIWTNVRDVYNVLVQTTGGGGWPATSGGTINGDNGVFLDTMYAGAKGHAEAAFATSAAGPDATSGGRPGKSYTVSNSAGRYFVSIGASDGPIRDVGEPTGCARDVDFYAFASTVGDAFNDFGDGITSGQYNKIATVTGAAGPDVTSGAVFNQTLPPSPGDPGPDAGLSWGYEFSFFTAFCIIKWNVVGGFTYQA